MYFGNRSNEKFTYRFVDKATWQEVGEYKLITGGSIEKDSTAELKETGTFNYEGYEAPDVTDYLRVYYSFKSNGKEIINPVATLATANSSLTNFETVGGLKLSGTLEGKSVLSVLETKLTGMPFTIQRGANCVNEAEAILLENGLLTDSEMSPVNLTADHTWDAGTSYLEIVNWLLEQAGYCEAVPDAMGTVILKPQESHGSGITFANDENSIMYPEVEEESDWQNVPNVARLLFNTESACVIAEARNESGNRSSLDKRPEATYFEEVSELGNGSNALSALENLAEETLIREAADIEYVTFSHAWLPISLFENATINYSEKNWTGQIANISIDLSPAVKTQTKIKRVLKDEIEISVAGEVLRDVTQNNTL